MHQDTPQAPWGQLPEHAPAPAEPPDAAVPDPRHAPAEAAPHPDPAPLPPMPTQPPTAPAKADDAAPAAQRDVEVRVAGDGASYTVDGAEQRVAAEEITEAVLDHLAKLAAERSGELIAAITDLRPGGFPQRVRVHSHGTSELLWQGKPTARPTASTEPAAAAAESAPPAPPADTPPADGPGHQAPPAAAAPPTRGDGFRLPPPQAAPAATVFIDAAGAVTLNGAPLPVPPGYHPEQIIWYHLGQLALREGTTLRVALTDLRISPDQQIVIASPPAHPAAPAPIDPAHLPSPHELEAGQRDPALSAPAAHGVRGILRRATGGLVALPPNQAEQEHRSLRRSVQRTFDGPKTIVVLNPKGGAHKTTTALLLAATFGTARGGSTVAWDNNETMGSMGRRALLAGHQRTVVDLFRDADRLQADARYGDLDAYVRSQGDAHFDALVSDTDRTMVMDGTTYATVHRILGRFYRLMVVDTGNNVLASNWQAAVETADELLIVSTIREDTAQSAAEMLRGLHDDGHTAKVRNAVTVLSAPGTSIDKAMADRFHSYFAQHTRAVLHVPHDPVLVDGGRIDYAQLRPATRTAWLRVAAAVADGL